MHIHIHSHNHIHNCSAMGRGKQWSVDTVRQVKALMSIGLPLPRIAAQTGVVLQNGAERSETVVSQVCVSLFSCNLRCALELSALKPCLVMPTGESDCKVTDCVSHVKRPQPHMMLSSSSTHIHMRTHVKNLRNTTKTRYLIKETKLPL